MVDEIIKDFTCEQCIRYKNETKSTLNEEYPNQLYYYHVCSKDNHEVVYSTPACENFSSIDKFKCEFKIKCLEYRIDILESMIEILERMVNRR